MANSRRLQLSAILRKIAHPAEVYFQPPKSKKMSYPCILYKLDGDVSKFAGNMRYLDRERYTLTIIDKNPDSELLQKVKKNLRYASFDRSYTADNLNHYVFTLYF